MSSEADDFLAELIDAMSETLGDLTSQAAQGLRCGFSIRRMGEEMRKHKHAPYTWDGYYEQCKCGASSGDRKDPETNTRYVSFSDWPEET